LRTPAITGLGNGSGFSIMIQDKEKYPSILSEQTQLFIQAAQERPEIGSAFTTFQAPPHKRYLDIDREKALKMGLT